MKITKVSVVLPQGVAATVSGWPLSGFGALDRLLSRFGESLGGSKTAPEVTTEVKSTEPITLVLEVPMGKEQETAYALRALATELWPSAGIT